MSELKDLMERAEQVRPVAEINGIKVVSFEQQRDLALLDYREGRENDLGTIQMNPDGTVARTPVKFAAVNLDLFYINRAKRVKDKLYVVTDSRAIREQSTGSVYLKQIPTFVIKRGENKELVLEKVVTVTDAEFVSEFTYILNQSAMAQILPLLTTGIGITTGDLGI